jgi:hypothetical protein
MKFYLRYSTYYDCYEFSCYELRYSLPEEQKLADNIKWCKIVMKVPIIKLVEDDQFLKKVNYAINMKGSLTRYLQ